MRSQIALFTILFSLLLPPISIGSVGNIAIQTSDGEIIPLKKIDLSHIKCRPLRKTKEKWDKKFKKEFLNFLMIDVETGEEVFGTYEVREGPLRLTIYQISKRKKAPRFIRILSTRFHHKNNIAEYRAIIEDLEENIFFITAEKTVSNNQLNQHIEYMFAQEGEVKLEGYSSNWNLSKLKLKFVGQDEELNIDSFVKDVDWLIDKMINPQWIIFIRINSK